MRLLFLFSFSVILFGCGPPEIKKPADIIAVNSKAVLFTPKLKGIFDICPPELYIFRDSLKGVLNENKAAVIAMTSFDPVEAYIALPVKEGLEESLKVLISDNLYLESEFWSGYVFVPLRGSLPSSYGNKEFLPHNPDSVLCCKVDFKTLLEGQREKLESFRKYKTLNFNNALSNELNRIITRFITHDLSDFAQQAELVQFELGSENLSGSLKLKPGTPAAKSFNSMKNFSFPAVPDKSSDFSFASAIDFSKLDFPLKGFETALKSYLAGINKPEAIFPMDTVFQKLRDSGKVRMVGYFKVENGVLKGEAKAVAENGENLYTSLSKFCRLMTPQFVSSYTEPGKAFFNPSVIRGKSIQTEFRMDMDTDKVILVDKGIDKPSLKLENSQEKGLLKIFIKPGAFLPFESGINKLKLMITVEENGLKFFTEVQK